MSTFPRRTTRSLISDQCIVAGCDRTAEALQNRLCCAHLSGSASGTTHRWSSSSPIPAPPGTGPQGPRGLRAGGVPAWTVGPERVVPQALRLLEAGRATRPVRLGGPRPDPREPCAGRVPAAVLRPVGRQPYETVLRRPSQPLGPAWPSRSRTLHRRLRAGRHRPHRPARAGPAAETGSPVRTAMPLRRPLPCCAAPHGHTRRPARLSAEHHLAAGTEREQWRAAAAARPNQSLVFLLDARYAIEALRDGTGWEVEVPEDVWRLDRLPGIAGPGGRPCPRDRLRFDRISHPQLRDLGKR